MTNNHQILIIDWNSRDNNDNEISVLNYIDQNEVRIRESYFSLIKSISNYNFNGKTINDYFQFNSAYNLWQMSSVCESSFYKSPQIINIIKFLAFDFIIREKMPLEIILKDAPYKINKIVENYCSSIKQKFKEYNPHKKETKSFSLDSAPFIKGFFYLIKIFIIHRNSFNHKINYFSGGNTLFIASYIAHLDKEKISKKIFGTGLWGDFPENLSKLDIKINWLLNPVDNKNSDKFFDELMISRQNKFNSYNFLYSYINYKSYLQIIIEYIIISLKSFKLPFNRIFNYENRANLFPLFKKDYLSSLRGPILAENLVYKYGYDELFKSIPNQKLGLYLQENQGWEIALISAWKKYGHGKLAAVQHSTVRFWDLRYNNRFKGNEKWISSPDLFIVNSISAKQEFLKLNYNMKKIYMFEALRYSKLKRNNNCKNSESRILILGDYLKKNTIEMLDIIGKSSNFLKEKKLYFKPHPAQPISLNEDLSNITVIDDHLSKVLCDFETVICSSTTGAAVEAFSLSLNTIVFISVGELNTSPLKGISQVKFFSSINDFINALNSIKNINQSKDYFLVDEKQPKWNEFIKSSV